MGDFSENEKRGDPRYHVHIKVDYKTKDMFLSNYVTNISKGGVFIETKEPFPVSSEIDLVLELPEAQSTIHMQGRVAWTYDIKKGGPLVILQGMGIKFTDIKPDEIKVLETYIEELSRQTETL